MNLTLGTTLLLDTTQPLETTPGNKNTKTKRVKFITGVRKYHVPGSIRLPNNPPKKITQGPRKLLPLPFGIAHHGEQQFLTESEPFRTDSTSPWTELLCCPGEACCRDAVCWRRAPSHEWGHERFVLRPSSNHPCSTRASGLDSSARGARHGTHMTCLTSNTGTVLLHLAVTPLLSPTLVLSDHVICKRYRYFHEMLSSSLVINAPIVVAYGIPPPWDCIETSQCKGANCRCMRDPRLVITPPAGRAVSCVGVTNIFNRTPPPQRESTPRGHRKPKY